VKIPVRVNAYTWSMWFIACTRLLISFTHLSTVTHLSTPPVSDCLATAHVL